MRILILGASGRLGKHLLEEALSKGHQVTCLVRSPQAISPHHNLSVVQGTPAQPEDLAKAMQGCEGLLSALNISRKSDFPWSGLRTPPQFLSQVMEQVLALAPQTGLRRAVVCSAWGVKETKKDLPFWFRWLINSSNIGIAYRDHERQEDLLQGSNLDWTVVRPVGLTNSSRREEVVASYANQPKPGLTISRSSAARYMVQAIEDASLTGKSPTIFGRKAK